MANYLRPDVYVEEVSSGEKPIQSVSTSTGALIGVTARGVDNQAVLVTSWTEFVEKFAKGLATPFLKNSDLPNAVYLSSPISSLAYFPLPYIRKGIWPTPHPAPIGALCAPTIYTITLLCTC